MRNPFGCTSRHFIGKRHMADRARGALVSGHPPGAGGCAEKESYVPLRPDRIVLPD